MDISYAFIKGKKYTYRSVFDQTHELKNGNDSFIHTVDMRIEVEDVDSAGNGTLVCTVLNQGYRRKGKGDTAIQRHLSNIVRLRASDVFNPFDEMPTQKEMTLNVIRPDVTPKFRAVLTSKGRFLRGCVLEKSASQMRHEELLNEAQKNPNITVAPVNADRTLRGEIENIFRVLPEMTSRAIGVAWSDTLFKKHEGRVYGELEGSYFTYTREQRDYLCTDRMSADSLQCRFLGMHFQKTQKTPSSFYSEVTWDGQEQTAFRAGDGGYLGFESVTRMNTLIKSNEDAEIQSSGRADFVVRVTLLSEE